MHGHDIGKGLSIFERWARHCLEDDEYSEAMGAPMDELYPIINRGRARAFRTIRRHIKAVTGLSWRMFVREVKYRTSERWRYFNTHLGFEESFR